jgi:hypothetical protein
MKRARIWLASNHFAVVGFRSVAEQLRALHALGLSRNGVQSDSDRHRHDLPHCENCRVPPPCAEVKSIDIIDEIFIANVASWMEVLGGAA